MANEKELNMMDNRFYPDWQSFAFKYRGREQDAFEDLARTLFRKEMGIKFGLFQRVNHKGNETEVVKRDGKVIGFQAKYFEHGIDADNIIHSMKEAKEGNPSQTHYYIYCNKAFGNPTRRKGSKKTGKIPNKTVNEEKIENAAKGLGLTLVWKLDKAILDEAISEKWIYDVFFNVHGKLDNLIKEERRHTEIAFNSINYTCLFNGQEIQIERNDIISQIEQQEDSSIMVIHGDGGCGKTAILHMFFDLYGNEVPVCYRKATSLNVRNLSEVFRQGDMYNFSDFKEAYKDCEKKYFIIDSAEHLDEIEDGTIVPSLLKGLMDDGWCIIFTIRNVFATDLLNLLSCELGKPEIKKVEISLLTENELIQVAETYGIQLPNDLTLLDRIRNLFYLNLYTRYYDEIDHQIKDTSFMQLVWEKKIRGRNVLTGYSRENEFEKFIADRIKAGSFFLPPRNYVSKEFSALIADEIIAVDPIHGLFITHDIFEEWGLYRIIDRYWNEADCVLSFLTNLGETRAIRRAFRLWLKDKATQNPDAILAITKAAFTDAMPGLWRDEVMCALLLSDNATQYFSNYEKQILNNTEGLADKIIWALHVGCQYVNEMIRYKDYYQARYAPVGSGWLYIIDLIYNNREKIKLSNWLPVLNDWTKAVFRGETTRKAGLIAISYYQSKTYKLELYKEGIQQQVHEIINNSVLEVDNELSTLLYRCLEEEDIGDDLVEFILRGNRGRYIHIWMPQAVIDLCEYYWMGRRKDKEYHNGLRPKYSDNSFDMYEYVSSWYFPPGADQTPLTTLLFSHNNLAVSFIIRLMNDYVDFYSTSEHKNTIERVIVTDGKDKSNWQWHSLSFWCMYRGTGSPQVPDLYHLQSAHMALERYLLNLSQEGQYDLCEAIMQRLLFECHSSSVSAIVGSIVMAFPDEYWKEALVLFRTIEFIKTDSDRAWFENKVESIYETVADINPKVFHERMNSNMLGHRNITLEDLCRRYQYLGSRVLSIEEIKALIREIFKILDEHRKRLKSMTGEKKKLFEILISSIDKRRLIVREQKEIEGGVEMQLEAKLSKGAKELRDKYIKKNQEKTKYLNLLTWAIGSYNGDLVINCYQDNPQKALEYAMALCKELEEDRVGFIGEPETPVWVSACLLKNYREYLSDSHLVWCKDLVMNKLNNIGAKCANVEYDSTSACIHLLPLLIDLFPKERGIFLKIMFRCLLAPDDSHTRASECLITSIRTFCLWEKDYALMKELVLGYIKEISAIPIQLCHIKVILGLIPNNPDQEMSDTAIRYLTIVPKCISDDRKNKDIIRVLDSLAYLFIHTESEEIMKHLFITNAIVQDHNLGESYLKLLIIEAGSLKKPDRFWTIWNSYRRLVAELIQTEKNEILRTYTFNIRWNDFFEKWHPLRQQDLEFFDYMGDHCQGNGVILEGLIHIFVALEGNFKTKGIGWISKAIKLHPLMSLKGTNVMSFLEIAMTSFVYAHKMQIRKDFTLLEQVRIILDFMVSRSSVTGFMLRDVLN